MRREEEAGPGGRDQSPRSAPAAPSQTPPDARPYLELLVARETRELAELQLDAGHLGHRAVRRPPGRVSHASADVHVRVRDLGGRPERRHQPIPKVFLIHTRRGQGWRSEARRPPTARARHPLPPLRARPPRQPGAGLRARAWPWGCRGQACARLSSCQDRHVGSRGGKWNRPPRAPGERKRGADEARPGWPAGTHGFLQEQRVPCQVVGAQQAPQDADGALKQVHVHVLLKLQLLGHPPPGFSELYANGRGRGTGHAHGSSTALGPPVRATRVLLSPFLLRVQRQEPESSGLSRTGQRAAGSHLSCEHKWSVSEATARGPGGGSAAASNLFSKRRFGNNR